MTLDAAIERFLVHCRDERGLSEKTLRAYGTDLRQFAQALHAGALDVTKVGKEEIRRYLAGLSTAYSVKSIKRKIASTRAMFRYLETDEVIADTPYRKLTVRLREPARLPRVLTLGDIQALFRASYVHAEGDQAAASRNVAVLELLFATGARVAEVCNLRAGDVDTQNGTVRLFGKGGRERVIQVCDPEALSALREYAATLPMDCLSAPLFRNRRGTRLTEASVRAMLSRCGRLAGLAFVVRPHMIRHTVATLLLDEGVDIRQIQILLGHRSIRTTELYTQLSSEAQRRLLTLKHPRRHFRFRE